MTEVKQAVFLSYASEDAAAAQRLCDALQAIGVEVWFDQTELRGGDAWDQKIQQQIRDCALFIPIISQQTAERPEGYFRLEWDLADQRTHMVARNKAFIVPVCIDDTRDRGADVPESFLRAQWTRLPRGATPASFCTRIAALLGAAEAPPSPLPGISRALPLTLPRKFNWRIAAAVAVAAAVALLAWQPWRAVPPKGIAASASAATEKSIAVLPFSDISEKHDQDYFADGIAEELRAVLVKIPSLKVIGRTSSMQFKGTQADLRTIGTRLGAGYVVEGSVRKSGPRIRVTAQLSESRSGTQLWAERYDRDFGDILNVQDQIATSIARALQLAVVAADV